MTRLEDMGLRLLRGAPIAADLREQVATDVADFHSMYGRTPALAVVMVGSDAPSAVYLSKILDGCRRVGLGDRLVELGNDATSEHLRDVICDLNADPEVAGIIVQMPLPPTIPLRTVIDTLDPGKDIDGIHPLNAGLLSLGYEGFLPATAHAAVELLKRSGVPLAGARAVVVGRSNVVGKPAALLLLREHATVTICHSRTPDLADHLRAADVVIVAAGRPGLVTGEMLKRGAVVVDIGINMVEGSLVGDVDFDSVARVASAIAPVPGGVGPLTNAILLTHLIRAARNQAEGRTALGARPGAPSLEVALR
ncbi:MAG: bifunctional 5,10-methylenetetrahydrofolate dehydrogenase/5,10-methenyltetrahydrofolate cyclohydrolase [Candidatus Limnocylindrales bacterium]|jgi:methylenetetrahydrofolate dehydrogenase (NADP+)/methenyltetrahydrofolate cyclohydrolase